MKAIVSIDANLDNFGALMALPEGVKLIGCERVEKEGHELRLRLVFGTGDYDRTEERERSQRVRDAMKQHLEEKLRGSAGGNGSAAS